MSGSWRDGQDDLYRVLTNSRDPKSQVVKGPMSVETFAFGTTMDRGEPRDMTRARAGNKKHGACQCTEYKDKCGNLQGAPEQGLGKGAKTEAHQSPG